MSKPPLYTTNGILKCFTALENIYGFQRVLLSNSPDSLEFNFQGIRPIWEDYIGVRVELNLKYSPKQDCWWIIDAEFGSVYMGEIDQEKEQRWRAESRRVLSGPDALAQKGKTTSARMVKESWVIKNATDLQAFMRFYDLMAQIYHCVAVFNLPG